MNSYETQESPLDPPKFARCSIGKGKWFWVACRNLREWCDRQLIASGIAATAIEAEAAAKASIAAECGSSVSEQWPAGFASQAYHREAVKRRVARATNAANDAADVEYVYTDWESDYSSACGSSPHRIVKKTAKRVYVEYRDSSWTENDGFYQDVETFVLDRQELETKGEEHIQSWVATYVPTSLDRKEKRIVDKMCR